MEDDTDRTSETLAAALATAGQTVSVAWTALASRRIEVGAGDAGQAVGCECAGAGGTTGVTRVARFGELVEEPVRRRAGRAVVDERSEASAARAVTVVRYAARGCRRVGPQAWFAG